MSTQHATLTADRWATFTLDQQILMIANEMHRAGKLLGAKDRDRLRHAYERVLRLTDLTIEVRPRPPLRRELLRWRDLVAALYVSARPGATEHQAALRCLLRFTPAASQQIPFVLGT
ncbi:MAG: hypothetical protein HYU51_05580 [Candidatus Rokubacteria bacterium]|nr:hypothetical protein [Candidatus Rokubacteria bacterium]